MASISLSTASPRPDLSEFAEQATTKLDQTPKQFVPWLAQAATKIGLDLSSLVKNPNLRDQLGYVAEVATAVHRGVGEILGRSECEALWETNQNQYSLDAIETITDVSRRFEVLFERQDLASLRELLESDKVLNIIKEFINSPSFDSPPNNLIQPVINHYSQSKSPNTSFLNDVSGLLRATQQTLRERGSNDKHNPLSPFFNLYYVKYMFIDSCQDNPCVDHLKDMPNLIFAFMEQNNNSAYSMLHALMKAYLSDGNSSEQEQSFITTFAKALPEFRQIYPDIESILNQYSSRYDSTKIQALRDLLEACPAPQS